VLKIIARASVVAGIAFLLALILLTAWRSYKQQHQTNYQASSEESDEKPNGATPPEKSDEAIVRYTLWLTIFTGVLAFVALVQIGFLISADRISAEAAAAAGQAAKTAKDTLTAANRPWVMAEGIEPLEPFPNMQTYCRIGYKVDIRNSGVSVAKSVIFNSRALKFPPTWDWLAGRVEELRTETIKLWSSKRPPNLPVGIALAPGQHIFPIRCPAYADGNDPTDDQIAKGAFLIIGYIQYADQFGLSHHTRFAFTPDSDSVRPWDGKTYAIYNDYQDAD
jgi:hypothetical protein